MRLAIATTLLVFASVAATAKADNFVSNPDFTPTNYQFPGTMAPATTTTVSGWTGGTNTGATPFNAAGFWDNGTLPAGDTTVGLIQGDGSLSTSLTGLTVGQTYELSFVENARDTGGVNATPTLTVSVGGTTILGPTAVDSVGGSNPFVFVVDTFVAGSVSEVLEFSSMTPGPPGGPGADGTLLLSDVAVSTTPEPSSLMLLGTGILGAAGMMRRRFLHS